jgi:predicted XRE-type DNA-binding protein
MSDPAIAVRKQALTAILARVAQLGLKNTDLGELLGLTRTRLDRLLDGDARAFNLDALVRIAARLDLDARLQLLRNPGGN